MALRVGASRQGLYLNFFNLASYKTVSVCQCVNSPQRLIGREELSVHGYELHGCVEGIRPMFSIDFFSLQLPKTLCLCGSVSALLRDPQGACDSGHGHELHGCVESTQPRSWFEFFFNLPSYKAVSVYQCVNSSQRHSGSMRFTILLVWASKSVSVSLWMVSAKLIED